MLNPFIRRPAPAGRLLFLFVAMLLPAARPLLAQAAPRDPVQVAVVGNDYTFGPLPDTLAAGPTLFSFENQGQVRHEMSMVLLRPGITLARILELLPTRPSAFSARDITQNAIGILIARPGEASGGRLYAVLEHGRTYAVVCTLKDSPDARPHVEMGMVKSFEVR